ncbi:hypothetical protein [uncultured Lamprocystis sp.]|jgi:hypothetical protein|uniref:hypothetical protein n=1 Tax=uncultured Lamprocystis sp. TaxID=543132 RepID=UPI0025F23886|nr:hypothetical protein [uncultured Lamprocystis sp.]
MASAPSLTLRALRDTLTGYAALLGDATPIVYALDGEGNYGLHAGAITAGYLTATTTCDPQSGQMLQRLQRLEDVQAIPPDTPWC